MMEATMHDQQMEAGIYCAYKLSIAKSSWVATKLFTQMSL